MKLFWSFLLVILLTSHGCDCGGDEVSFSCPPVEDCYVAYGQPNTESYMITGERLERYTEQVCNFGQTVCDEETQTIVCEGIKYPATEICDGKDNDCNGVIDDGDHLLVSSFNTQNPCRETELGVCKYSDARCVLGDWICIPPHNYGEEVCDGRDNDCDGEVDEDIPQEFVYVGPPETLNVGECRAGVSVCENGITRNFGMVTPIEEICGNGDDDDCDGLTDELEIEPESYDFALILDVSGSMTQYLYSVNIALCDWANTSRFDNSRFAIVGVAMNPNNGALNGVGLITDFTDSIQACNILNNFLTNTGVTIANEYQLDAILRSMTVGDNIDLTWSNTRQKKIVVFSDEQPQHVYQSVSGVDTPTLEEKLAEIVESCNTTDTSVNIFTPYGMPWNSIWDDITSYCRGYLEYLVFNPFEMVERLNYWFGEEC